MHSLMHDQYRLTAILDFVTECLCSLSKALEKCFSATLPVDAAYDEIAFTDDSIRCQMQSIRTHHRYDRRLTVVMIASYVQHPVEVVQELGCLSKVDIGWSV